MNEHPIQGLMSTAMESIKDMVDVNTVIGEPVTAPNGTVIIPISKVSFGFLTGGSEFSKDDKLPFGGGSGAGVSINPMGFLVVNDDEIKVIPAYFDTSLDRVLELVPNLIDKVINSLKKE